MITKQIIILELHFDSPQDCDKTMGDYKDAGYEILNHGSEDDWYFKCKREE